MSRALYHIQQELSVINEELISSGGELTPELESKLAITQTELSEKARNYGLVILSNESDITAIDAEIKRLEALKAPLQATNKKLKETVANAMLSFGIEKVESPLCKLSFRKSEAVEVFDEAQLNQKYFNYKPTVDKTTIKADLKEGIDVAGARLVTNQNLQIK